MKPTTEILARISQNSLANKEEVFTKLYRYLLRPDIYFVAYKNLYANSGAATKGVAIQKEDGSMFPVHRKYLVGLTDLEIVSVYNAELRGICNYYGMASNFCKLHYFAYLMEYSCLKTLASKHKTSLSKTIDKFKDGTGKWGIPYETKQGNKRCYFANYADCKGKGSTADYISNAAVVYGYAVNTLENRLKAKVCELCGTTESDHYEVHHINKLKNLKGKERWEIAMIAKHRKTLVVCRDCHRSIIHKK